MESIDESALVITRKPPRAKYSDYSRTSYKKETCYKLHPKQRPSASPITDVLFAAHSEVSHSVLLTNPHSMLDTAHSDFSHSVLPVASRGSITNPHSALPIAAAHSTWILDTGATAHIYSDIDLFNNIAPISAMIAWGNAVTLPARGNRSITVALPNSASAVLDSVLYMPNLGINILSVSRLLQHGARIAFEQDSARILLESSAKLQAITNPKGLFYLSFYRG